MKIVQTVQTFRQVAAMHDGVSNPDDVLSLRQAKNIVDWLGTDKGLQELAYLLEAVIIMVKDADSGVRVSVNLPARR